MVSHARADYERQASMTMDAFVPADTNRGRGNDGSATGAKQSNRAARPVQRALRTIVRMAAVALPARWLWEKQLALGNVATTMTGDSQQRKSDRSSEVPFLAK
jgi:hypothetical protein